MPQVTIYTSPFCPYCYRAKGLLDCKGVAYDEIDVSMDPGARNDMVRRAGGKTSVPQIFIGERHVGGSDELYALNVAGELDPLLIA